MLCATYVPMILCVKLYREAVGGFAAFYNT